MNATLHDYLDALGTWLAESGGYDKNGDKVQPGTDGKSWTTRFERRRSTSSRLGYNPDTRLQQAVARARTGPLLYLGIL